MQKITIQLRNVYGATKAYPADESAQIFARMIGTKTLTQRALLDVLCLGYAIEVQGQAGGTILPNNAAPCAIHALQITG